MTALGVFHVVSSMVSGALFGYGLAESVFCILRLRDGGRSAQNDLYFALTVLGVGAVWATINLLVW